MPPTFFFVIGFIVYLFLVGLTLVIGVPLLFTETKKLFAQKALGIVLVSFPSLIAVTIVIGALLALPGLLFLWLLNAVTLENRMAIITFLVGLLFFVTVVAISSLYVGYFFSRLIINYVDKKPLEEIYNQDKVYQYFKKLLIKFKLLKLGDKNYR
jgi:hypothetical protein